MLDTIVERLSKSLRTDIVCPTLARPVNSPLFLEDYTLPEGRSLGLKVVYKDGRPEYWNAPEGFRWNLTPGGWTEAPDWNSAPKCGGGLHVWAWAQGDLSVSGIDQSDVVWMAVEYEEVKAVDLKGKIKVPKCKTIAVGDHTNRSNIASFVHKHAPPLRNRGAFFVVKKAGDDGEVDLGYSAVAIVGDRGLAVTGGIGIAIAGDRGRAFNLGSDGYAVAGHGGHAKTGYCGVAIAGDEGIAEATQYGIAIAGNRGTAKGALRLSAGEGGTLIFDLNQSSLQVKVGENGIKPDTFYQRNYMGDLEEIADMKWNCITQLLLRFEQLTS